MTSQWSKTDFSENSGNEIIMVPKRPHISKFLSSIEKAGQYDSFEMPINSLRQSVTALGQIFRSTLVTPVTLYLVKTKKKKL